MSDVTLRALREFSHRVNPEERQGAYGLYFIRPFSIYFTYLALKGGLTANQVTVLQTVVGMGGAICLAFPSPTMAWVAICLLQFGFVLDNVDGEVARYRRQVSVTGKYLDTLGHQYVGPAMFFCLGLGTYLRLGSLESIVFGFSAGLFSLRFDIINMYHEAAQLVESRSDKLFNYYAALRIPGEGASAETRFFRQKNVESRLRILYSAFAYPALMNILSALLVFDLFLLPLWGAARVQSTLYWALAFYGIALPLRRCYTIRQIVKAREVEKKYLSLLGETTSKGDAPGG
jgi:hypothetical protein